MKPEELGAYYESILEKEVRKEGGIYYTPQYIVDYIVQNTVGKLLEGKTPKEASNIKIVDPACGAGIFLLGAYQYLLDWHKKHFGKLTLAKRRKILTECIFGVDIDPLAVEMTKYCLSMKCTNGKDFALDLDNNIKCGNSLIDLDYYDNQLDFGEERKVKPFSWKKAFPDAFKQGGFDCVIGNPPWGANLIADKGYFKSRYENATPDSAAYFLERAVKLSQSMIGMIVPKTIAFYSSWQSIRKVLLEHCRLGSILDVGIAFSQVNLESVVLILDKKDAAKNATRLRPKVFRAEPLKRPHVPKEIVALGTFDTKIVSITQSLPMIGLNTKESNLIWKLHGKSIQLGDVADNIFRGLYISDAEKKTLRRGKTKWINKVPDVKRWLLTKIHSIALPGAYKAKAQDILVPRVFLKVLRGSRLIAFPDVKGEYLTTEKLVSVTICREKYPVSYLFLSAVLNSPIVSWYLQKVLFSDTTETARVMDRVYSQYMILPRMDLAKREDKQSHDLIVKHVDQLLQLNRDLQVATLPNQKELIKSRIAYSEDKINGIVYELYGLTESEIQTIETNL